MWSYVFFFAVLQYACASPILPCSQLESYISREFNTFTREAVLEGAKLLHRVLDDAQQFAESDILSIDREALEAFTKFIDRIEKSDDSEELEELVYELSELLGLEEVSLELDDPDDFLRKILHQHGFEEFERNLVTMGTAMLKRIEIHIEAYLKKMQGFAVKSSALSEWLKAFKKEEDFEMKMMLFSEIFENIHCAY